MPSSVISTMSYDAATATLRITFVSGMIYDYKNVPEEIYHALKTSGAKGIYLNQHIKGRYPFEKIK
ncbi:MAG: ATPase protein [Chitinophagaceae bacterium]|nr:ATPase protein [Chitinophagaceae bacterium]MDB5224072.1 ATPase protein [Chitinophagaceae bacterium]